MIDRRALLSGAPLALAASALPAAARPRGTASRSLPAFYADLEQRTFRWFWETARRDNGLVPDRYPSPSFCSIASVGFALTAYPIGVERGWITRAEARDLTLTTLRFFWEAPQGPERDGRIGHKGFFYHFIGMIDGTRFDETELSSVDSSLLFMGMLFAAQYFDRADAKEREIRDLAHKLYARADWNFFREDSRRAISMGWHPGRGLIERNWEGYNEGMLVYLLALGAPEHPVPADSWEVWTAPYAECWRGEGPTRHLTFAPLFGHQYSHVWIDFRGIRDRAMREAGFDYFENSRRATYANRAYCTANPQGWDGWSKDIWGLTACDGPGDYRIEADGKTRQFIGYSARGPLGQPDGRDDGTLAPTAALGALPFAPEIVIPAAEALRREHGPRLYGKYGFYDAFNPSFRFADKRVERGWVDPVHGWYDSDYIGIDQGPILAMAANYRSDFVWRHMRRCAPLRRGLHLAGFTGGWLG